MLLPASSKEKCQFLILNYARKINSSILIFYFPLRVLVFPEQQQQKIIVHVCSYSRMACSVVSFSQVLGLRVISQTLSLHLTT